MSNRMKHGSVGYAETRIHNLRQRIADMEALLRTQGDVALPGDRAGSVTHRLRLDRTRLDKWQRVLAEALAAR